MSPRSAGVGGLFLACCPSTIGLHVGSVIVNSVNSQSGRPWTHVCVEGREQMPSGADVDPPTTIVFVLLMVLVLAASQHRVPGVILGGVALAVSGEALCRGFTLQATAALRRASLQVVDTRNHDRAAVAATLPLPAVAPDTSYGYQSAESLPCQIVSSIQAPACESVAIPKKRSADHDAATAFALTQPHGGRIAVIESAFNHDQAPVLTASHFDKSHVVSITPWAAQTPKRWKRLARMMRTGSDVTT